MVWPSRESARDVIASIIDTIHTPEKIDDDLGLYKIPTHHLWCWWRWWQMMMKLSSKRTKRRKIENWDFIRLDLIRAPSSSDDDSSSYHLPRNLCICPSLYHLAFQCIYWALTVCEIDARTISCSVSPGFDDTYPITRALNDYLCE